MAHILSKFVGSVPRPKRSSDDEDGIPHLLERFLEGAGRSAERMTSMPKESASSHPVGGRGQQQLFGGQPSGAQPYHQYQHLPSAQGYPCYPTLYPPEPAYDHSLKMTVKYERQPTQSYPTTYERLSKKKLAAQMPEKAAAPATTTTLPLPSQVEPDRTSERHKVPKNYDRSGYERTHQPPPEPRPPELYDLPPSGAYDRLTSPPPANPPTFERLSMFSSYDRNRAVFDRAYEAAAYDRRSLPFASPNPSYYALNKEPPVYPKFVTDKHHPDEYDVKDAPSSTYPAKPRMSLLTSPEYLSSLSRRTQQVETAGHSGQTSVIVPPSRSSPENAANRKKSRTDYLEPLTIDVSAPKPSGGRPALYMPTVEPISPTSPPDPTSDDVAPPVAAQPTLKDNLLRDLTRVDREINKIEHLIFGLKKKEVEIAQKALKVENNLGEEATEGPLPQHFSLSHKVYSENRRKARESHSSLSHLGPPTDLPLYNQPSDTAVYRENQLRHSLFKGRLIAHLRRRRAEKCTRERRLTEEYGRRTELWTKAVEKLENSPERKRRDAENRELFEKMFPKIRKEREDKERFLRVGSRVKSDADLEEIMDNLHEQEMELKKMRDYAAVPPLLLPVESRQVVFVNNNGLVDDLSLAYKESRLHSCWTQQEKDTFREKYLLYPKNFGVVASYLEKKSVADCVQYYYLSKKTENYKRLLKKTGQKPKTGRTRGKAMQQQPEQAPPPPLPPPTIAPRFQRDYKPEVAAVDEPPEVTGDGRPPQSTDSLIDVNDGSDSSAK